MLLLHAGARDEALDLLLRGQAAHLGDYFINLHLGVLHPKSELGARYLTAAVALHPDIPEAKEQRERRLAR